jgi:hypothetical protein
MLYTFWKKIFFHRIGRSIGGLFGVKIYKIVSIGDRKVKKLHTLQVFLLYNIMKFCKKFTFFTLLKIYI